MNRRFSIAFVTTLILLAFLAAVSNAEPAAVPLPVTNVDGTWSNPDTGSSIDCLTTENSPGDDTNENKIHAGSVNGDSSNCYTDSPYNAAPYNDGSGYSEGSGFGFDGSNGTLNVQPSTPFLVGLITHYNRRISSNSGISGADLDVTIDISGATPGTNNFEWDVLLDETPNTPGSNSGDICPYPENSFYSSEYLAFNGGYDNSTNYPFTFGTPKDHPNVNGNPPSGIRQDNWLCGDKLTAQLTSPNQTTFQFDGQEYTLVLLGVSYPAQNVALNKLNDVPADVCGTFPGVNGVDPDLETKELEVTHGCLWAQFSEPSTTAITLSGIPQANQTGLPLQTLFIILVLGGLILSGLFYRQRSVG